MKPSSSLGAKQLGGGGGGGGDEEIPDSPRVELFCVSVVVLVSLVLLLLALVLASVRLSRWNNFSSFSASKNSILLLAASPPFLFGPAAAA